MNLSLLDCTLRDGGYYNNWEFQNNLLHSYISKLKKSNIDVIEIGLEVVKMGRTSITIRCEARVKKTQRTIIRIEKMVFVNLDENLKPLPHNKVYEE